MDRSKSKTSQSLKQRHRCRYQSRQTCLKSSSFLTHPTKVSGVTYRVRPQDTAWLVSKRLRMIRGQSLQVGNVTWTIPFSTVVIFFRFTKFQSGKFFWKCMILEASFCRDYEGDGGPFTQSIH